MASSMGDVIQVPDLPVLEEAETKELLKKAQSGDREARDKLVRHNLKLVLKVVYRFRSSGYDLEELFQIGSIGLLKAVDNFDLTREARFSTYALPRIIGEIRSFLRDDAPLKVSRDIKRKGSKLKSIARELTSRYSREPTLKELSRASEIPIPELVEIMEAMKEPLSLDMPLQDSGEKEVTLSQQIADEHQPGETFHLDLLQLRQVLGELDHRSRMIVYYRFFQEESQKEVADRLDISQVHVSRLERQVLEEIKERLSGNRDGAEGEPGNTGEG